MKINSLQDLERALQNKKNSDTINYIGKSNCQWILENHHLYNLNEITHRLGISRRKIIQFFKFCGISTEIIYNAGYTTPRAMGEMAGKARENGYIVEGQIIRYNAANWWKPNFYFEKQAISLGYRIFDVSGNELVHNQISRPKILAKESKSEMLVEEVNIEIPEIIYPTDIVKVKNKSDEKSGTILMETIRSSDGQRELNESQQVRLPKNRARYKGYIGYESYNKGNGVRGTRWYASVMVNGVRHRFRSTNLLNVKSWLSSFLEGVNNNFQNKSL